MCLASSGLASIFTLREEVGMVWDNFSHKSEICSIVTWDDKDDCCVDGIAYS